MCSVVSQRLLIFSLFRYWWAEVRKGRLEGCVSYLKQTRVGVCDWFSFCPIGVTVGPIWEVVLLDLCGLSLLV